MTNTFTTKKLLLSSIFLIASILLTQAQTKTDKAISSIMQAQEIAWNSGDLDAFMIPYWRSDSLKFIGKTGITYGWENTLNNYKKGYPDKTAMGILQFTNLHMTQLSKRWYSVTGKWYLKRTIGDLQGHYTLLWQKIKGKWFIVQDHSS